MQLPIDKLFALAGGATGLQKAFGLKTVWAAAKWLKRRQLPPYRIIPACRLVGFSVTPHQLDKRLYPNPHDGIPTNPQHTVETNDDREAR
jgi:hypothetical protein